MWKQFPRFRGSQSYPQDWTAHSGTTTPTRMTNDRHRFEKVASLFHGSDRAVSPIVATLILIALVVVMGGAVATMLYGFGSGTSQTPHAKFTFSYQESSNSVIIRDTGGPKLTEQNTLHLNVTVNGNPATLQSGGSTWSLPVKAGDQANVTSVNSGDHISVVWIGPNGKSTQSLASFDVP